MTHYAAAVLALEHSVTGEGNFGISIYLLEVWGFGKWGPVESRKWCNANRPQSCSI